MARAKGPAGGGGQANGISKMEGVRKALAQLGKKAKPVQIGEYLKTELGISMSTGMISNYKSILKKKKGKRGAKARGEEAGEGAAPTKRAAGPKGGFSLDDVRAVKQLADRIGAEKVRELATVLTK